MTDQEAAALGAEALAQVKDGDVVGLGTGQAATAFIRALGAAVNAGLAVTGVPTSEGSAALARTLFAEDAELTREYNEVLSGGKWSHLMDQTHIGYTYWNQPPRNAMPGVQEVQPSERAEMGIAVEGSEASWPGGPGQPTLPALNVFDGGDSRFEVFNRGLEPFSFTVEASEPWLEIDSLERAVGRDRTVRVRARWPDVPVGAEKASLPADPCAISSRRRVLRAICATRAIFSMRRCSATCRPSG